jgi:hypothetical protein
MLSPQKTARLWCVFGRKNVLRSKDIGGMHITFKGFKS